MPGRGDDINHAVADVQMRDSLWPMLKLKESTHGGQVRSDDLNIWRRSELYVASVMIAVSVGMHDKQGKADAVLKWQKRKDSLCQRHLGWICEGAGVDQQTLWRSNKQIENTTSRTDAATLTKDESLRFVAA